MAGMVGNRRYVKEFGPSEFVSGVFAIANAQLGRTKQDKPFLKCLIGDKTGMLPARMWSIDPGHFKRLPVDGFVFINAETQPYQGELRCGRSLTRGHARPDSLFGPRS
jgi:23S rRNA maturation-related 3'-5' exoribonuclease YhaM